MFVNIVIAICLWTACAADFAWPTWNDILLRPSFLDLAFVLATFCCRPAMIVFWGGVAGLLTTVLYNGPPQLFLLSYAFVAFITASQQQRSIRRLTFSRRMVQSLWMLTLLGLLRAGFIQSLLTGQIQSLQPQHLGGLALTFLCSLLICIVMASTSPRESWERSSL